MTLLPFSRDPRLSARRVGAPAPGMVTRIEMSANRGYIPYLTAMMLTSGLDTTLPLNTLAVRLAGGDWK